MSALYNYVKNQWVMGAYSVDQMALCVTKRYITQAEADQIMALPQVSEVALDGA